MPWLSVAVYVNVVPVNAAVGVKLSCVICNGLSVSTCAKSVTNTPFKYNAPWDAGGNVVIE